MKIFTFLWILFVGSLFADEAPMKVGNFTFKGGDAWVAAKTSPMVKAAVTHGKDGPLLKFYHFGQGQGGGIDANIKRWKGQFQGEAKLVQEDKTYGDQKVAIVTITGTYLVGPPFGEKVATKGQALLGAVIPHPSGDVFLKMTGPEADIAKTKEDFVKLIESAVKK